MKSILELLQKQNLWSITTSTFCFLLEERMVLDLKLNKTGEMKTDSVQYMALPDIIRDLKHRREDYHTSSNDQAA